MNTSTLPNLPPKSNSDSRAWKGIKVTQITPAKGGTSARAYADVRLETDIGELTIYGFCIFEKEGGGRWVNFPHRHRNHGRDQWYPMAEATGNLRQLIIAAIIDAYVEFLESGH